MPTYRVSVEVYVTADDADDAAAWVEFEVFPVAHSDNPIMGMAYESDGIVEVSEDDLSSIKEDS